MSLDNGSGTYVGALAGQQQGANELGKGNKSEPLDFLRSAISVEGNWYCKDFCATA
jgi:hypothetical protein